MYAVQSYQIFISISLHINGGGVGGVVIGMLSARTATAKAACILFMS